MKFTYEAMSASGELVQSTLDAENRDDAAATLRGKGMLPVKLELARSEAAEVNPAASRARLADLCLFCRQLKMLLEAGASLVPALEALEHQTTRLGFRSVLRKIRRQVETGRSFTQALQEFPHIFGPVFVSMIAAGERSATLPRVFERLSALMERQRATRNVIVSAAIYPALLGVISSGVVALLLYFVVPRFHTLFTNLNRPLPASTKLLFTLSELATGYWPFFLGGTLTLVALVVAALWHPFSRALIDRQMLYWPIVGRLIRQLETGRMLRVWAAMLGARLPLLDAIDQSRSAVTNRAYRDLVDELALAVAAGRKIGQFLQQSGRVEPVIASAMSTGEDNGRLAEATEFVSNWLDQDIEQSLTRLARLSEPLLLTLLGLVVGAIAMALFLPLFDIATAG